MNYVLQCTYEKAQTRARSVVYNIVDQKILLDLLRREMMDEFLDNHIGNVLDTSDAVDRICGKLLSTYAFIAPISAFIQHRTGQTVAGRCITTKVENHSKEQMLDSDLKCDTSKSISHPSRID